MAISKNIKKFLAAGLMVLGLSSAYAGTPGCVGKMWNPLSDLDFRLMGGIKLAGFSLMSAPKQLGEPPNHKAKPVCFCKNGMQTGFGLGLTFWMPSYINDMARQAGCLGFLGGTNILKGFMSLSSGQEYSRHEPGKQGSTSMQVHWAYADVTAIAGKSLFEKCDAVTGAMSIAYMTEPDFIYQNDIYSVIMTPQASIVAASPLLTTLACGYESIANTLGDWQDFGICAWQGSRLPLSGTSISQSSAQVTNMDVTIKYLTRSALLGTTLRTMGKDTTCKPKYSPFYDPFQHRFQWAYPAKTATRYNVDVMKWGLSIRDKGQGSLMSLSNELSNLAKLDSTSPSSSTPGALGLAEQIVKKLPMPLNYPTREAGYMQVWEARQCCLMVFTLQDLIEKLVENIATAGGGMVAVLYEYYNMANEAYQWVTDPIGAGLGAIGDGIADSIGGAVEGLGESLGSLTS